MLIITMMAQYRSATANTLFLYKPVALICSSADIKQATENKREGQLLDTEPTINTCAIPRIVFGLEYTYMICFALANFQHHTRTWCRFPPSWLPWTVQRELNWRALGTAMSLLRMSSIHTGYRSYSRELSDSVKKSSIHRRLVMCCRYAADVLSMCWSRNLAARVEIKCQIQSLLAKCRNYNIRDACCSRHIHIYVLLYLCICMWEYINVNRRERSIPSDLLKYDVK